MTTRRGDAFEREVDLLLERSGIAVPPDRRAGVIAGCRDLARMTELLRQPREAESEPASVYDVRTIARGS